MEWLTRDPLNGIAITVAFFSSLIIGRYLRKKIDLRIKILALFFLIISATLIKHWYLLAIISISCIAIALKLHVIRDYIKRIIFPFILALFILTIQSFNNIEGLKYGFLIFSRVLACASILILLILTIPEEDLLGSMRWLRVPGIMIEISSFMIRYIQTFSYEGRRLKLAQESRCSLSRGQSFRNRMNNTASICGLLITRAFARSDEVYRAMISRAWRPGLRYYTDHQPLDKKDMVLGLVFFSGIIGLIGFDRFL